MAYLILVRHGHSAWNKLGLWTGHTDVSLAPEGHEEAQRAGEILRDVPIHHVQVSLLRRTHETAQVLLAAHGTEVEHVPHAALNERHYGIHTGKNKWQVKEEIGDEAFQRLRRAWNEPIPQGETLKDVHARVVPHYEREVLPRVVRGENVLIVAHGNTIRALVKHLEDIDELAIADVEIATGEVLCYELDADGVVLRKDVRRTPSE